MTSPKHTPGPWHMGRAVTRECGPGMPTFHEVPLHVGAAESYGNCFATVHAGGPGATDTSLAAVESNARVMVAAPVFADFVAELLQGGALPSDVQQRAQALLRAAGRPELSAAQPVETQEAATAKPEEERWYASRDEDDWSSAAVFSSREAAISGGPAALRLEESAEYFVGQGCTPGSGLTAEAVVEMLDNHAADEGSPDGTDAYAEGDSYKGVAFALGEEPLRELQSLLDAWAAKYEIRPRWFIVERVSRHEAPTRG